MKRLMLYLLIILLCISIYKDLSLGNSASEEIIVQSNHSPQSNYTIMQLKITTGDTVLTVIEKINDAEDKQLDISRIMADFQQLNPTADPYQLVPNTFYYFPLYN